MHLIVACPRCPFFGLRHSCVFLKREPALRLPSQLFRAIQGRSDGGPGVPLTPPPPFFRVTFCLDATKTSQFVQSK